MQTVLEKKSPRLARLCKEFEVQFKWAAIWWLLFFLRKDVVRKAGQVNPQKIRSVLFLRYDKIGDMVVTLPTFHLLKRHLPHLRIAVLASARNAAIIRNDPNIDEVFLYRKSKLITTLKTLLAIRRRQYDVTIDLVTGASVTSLIITMLAGGGSTRIGMGKGGFGRYYDYYTREETMRRFHIGKLCRASLVPFGIPLEVETGSSGVCLSEKEWRRGAEIIRNLRKDGYQALVGINISAGRINRAWGVDRYAELITRIVDAYPQLQLAIIVDPKEYRQAEELARLEAENIAIIPPGLNIIDIISVMKHLDLIMSPDTSICHIASSLNVPLLALYSASEAHFARWHPNADRSWILRSPEKDSLDGITVEDYFQKIQQVFAELFQLQPVH